MPPSVPFHVVIAGTSYWESRDETPVVRTEERLVRRSIRLRDTRHPVDAGGGEGVGAVTNRSVPLSMNAPALGIPSRRPSKS